MKIDLNIQSKWSSGDIAPLELVLRATASGITHIALCDYSSVKALEPLKNIANTYGIKVINGVSFRTYDTISHQLVTLRCLAFDPSHPDLAALCHPDTVLETEEVVTALSLLGGKVILANPHEIDTEDLMERLILHGLNGVERFYPGASEFDLSAVDAIIKDFGLIVTGGSYDETYQWDGLLNGQYLCSDEVLPRLMNYKRVAVV